ncbi:histidine kinase dimerization/phosphoacceptor domain -containing protein [Brumimicrobium oceani]|uniref:histidine kinase n=1 Tax=Brumimicrobium oceani TaxID=2100725 RepID=A0A2U2XGF8_9FLAO|nr:transporter substrate-binding domain-containing protein [Brumimicrobium oceani]PWH86888.1 hypothetical protein DIT68_01110 [Brumimicrobium oceani]
MKSYNKHLLLVIAVLFSIFSFAQEINFTEEEKQWIEEHPIIEFGYDTRWEPYELFSFGQYGGIVNDYITILEEKTGIKMVALPKMNWEKSFDGLMNGSIMVIPSCVYTKKRAEYFDLSVPYIEDPIVIVASSSSPYFSKLSDLSGKTVSISKNYYTKELLKDYDKGINIKEFESIERSLLALLNGESDAFVGNLNVVSYYINHYGFDKLKIVGTTPFKDNGICFAVNPKWSVFTGIVNKVIKQISPETKHQIREKWIAGKNKKQYSTSLFIWTSILMITLIVLLIIIYSLNRKLKARLKHKREVQSQLKKLLAESKKSEKEKQVLLQEIHHRVKNNLQIVSSVLSLQSNVSNDDKTREALKEAMDRIASIALVHRKMYQSPESKIVNLKDYTESLFIDICSQYPKVNHVLLEIKSEEKITSTLNSIMPLALILNELITNSLKYAFHSQENPKISIEFIKEDNSEALKVRFTDNGSWIESEVSDYFGTTMIEIFTEQIEGVYTLTKDKSYTEYLFSFNGISTN